MLAVLVAVPLLAVFGIPELAPVSTSSSADEAFPASEVKISDGIEFGKSNHHSDADLFAPNSPNQDVDASHLASGGNGFVSESTQADSFKQFDSKGQAAANDSQNLPRLEDHAAELSHPGRAAFEVVEIQEPVSRDAGAITRTGIRADEPDGTVSKIGLRDRVDSNESIAGAPREGFLPSGDHANIELVGGTADAVRAVQGSSPAVSKFIHAPEQPGDETGAISQVSGERFDRRAGRGTDARRLQQAEDERSREQRLSSQPLTWRTAVRRLNKLGIRHFQLEPGARENEFQFSCSLTPSDQPRISHRFEAEAAEPLRAVERVLIQIEQWLDQR
jgi:hypothetical protein